LYVTIDPPYASGSSAWGINNLGQIVGQYHTGDETHGFLLRKGVYTTLHRPGSTTTVAYGINDHGEVVGWYDEGKKLLEASFFTPAPTRRLRGRTSVASSCTESTTRVKL